MIPSFSQKIQDGLNAERPRWALWLPVGLGLGIILYFMQIHEPWIGLGPSLLSLLLFLGFAVRRFSAVFYRLVMIAVVVCVGFTAAQLRAAMIAAPQLAQETGTVSVSGRVVDWIQQPDAVQLILDTVTIESLLPADTPARVKIRFRKAPENARVGDYVTVLAQLRPPTVPNFPGGYDFARDAYFKQIGATGFALGGVRAVEKQDATGLNMVLETWRQKLTALIVETLPGADENGSRAIVIALLTGEANAIPTTSNDVLRDAGLFHIISISGLHIGFVAAFVFFTIRLILTLIPGAALHLPIKKIAALIAIIGVVLFTIFVGAPVPAQRSALMAGLVLFAVMLDRMAISLRLVAFAATFILLIFPESLLSASFQLSFAAVIGMVTYYETLHVRFHAMIGGDGVGRKIGLYLFDIIMTSVVAGLATAPFVIYNFQSTQLYGVLANMLGVPLTGFVIMPFGLLAYFTAPFGLHHWPLQISAWGVDGLMVIAGFVAALPGAVLRMPALPPVAIWFFVLGGLMMCLVHGRMRWVGLSLVVIGFCTVFWARFPVAIIAPKGKVLAAQLDNGEYAIYTARTETFYTDSWLRRVGQKQAAEWPIAGAVNQNLACDKAGCILQIGVHNIAFTRDADSFYNECGTAHFIINLSKRFYDCPASRVFHMQDKDQRGTLAFYTRGDGMDIDDSEYGRGNRPWSAHAPAIETSRDDQDE